MLDYHKFFDFNNRYCMHGKLSAGHVFKLFLGALIPFSACKVCRHGIHISSVRFEPSVCGVDHIQSGRCSWFQHDIYPSYKPLTVRRTVIST
jgi:hypothetical protein